MLASTPRIESSQVALGCLGHVERWWWWWGLSVVTPDSPFWVIFYFIFFALASSTENWSPKCRSRQQHLVWCSSRGLCEWSHLLKDVLCKPDSESRFAFFLFLLLLFFFCCCIVARGELRLVQLLFDGDLRWNAVGCFRLLLYSPHCEEWTSDLYGRGGKKKPTQNWNFRSYAGGVFAWTRTVDHIGNKR